MKERLVAIIVLLSCFIGRPSAQLPGGLPQRLRGLRSLKIAIDSPQVRQSFSYYLGGQDVQTIRFERSPASTDPDDFIRRGSTLTTSYLVLDVAQRNGGDELFVAGVKANGESIIEKWVFGRINGEYVVDYPAPTALGSPAGPFVPALHIKGGGAYKLPKGPGGLILEPVAQRSILYEGGLGPFLAIEADPEGRFLLMWSYSDHSVRQLLLTAPGASPASIYNASAVPALAQIYGIEAREFGPPGTRRYLLRSAFPGDQFETYTVLSDDENDGVFESADSYDSSAWEVSPLGNWGQWTLFYKVSSPF